MGIEIANLRTEIQTLVNSAPAKYDPNANGIIDEGEELSLLLSEYQCNKPDLTSKNGTKMWTLAELAEIDKNSEKESKESRESVNNITGFAIGVGALTSLGYAISAGTAEPYKHIPKLKKISDGSYIPGAKPAADIYNSINSKPYMITHFGGRGNRPVFETLQELADSSRATKGVVIGEGGLGYNGLRPWQPGDPQFVKDLKDTVTVKSNLPKQLLKKAGLIGGGIILLSIIGNIIMKSHIDEAAKEKAKREIKANQTKIGADIMDQTRARQEEMRQQELKMKQDEVEYRERMEKATKNVERNVASAHKKAVLLNKELKGAENMQETK